MERVDAIGHLIDLKQAVAGESPEIIKSYYQSSLQLKRYAEAISTLKQTQTVTLRKRQLPVEVINNTEDSDIQPTSEQAEAIKWASNTLEQYQGMPKVKSKDRKAARALVDQAVNNYLANPATMGTVLDAWVAREPDQDLAKPPKKDDEPTFLRAVSQKLLSRFNEQWRTITPEQLASVTRIIGHNNLSSELAKTLLKSYFEGPNNISSVADCAYTYTFAALDLLDDASSLKVATETILAVNGIIPFAGRFNINYYLAAQATINNDEVLQKAKIADRIMFDLTCLAGIDQDQIHKHVESLFDTREYSEACTNYVNRQIKQNPAALTKYDLLMGHYDQLAEIDGDTLMAESTDALEAKINQWPLSLFIDPGNKLNQKYHQKAASLVGSKIFEMENYRMLRLMGENRPVKIGFGFDSQLWTELIFESSLAAEQPAILKAFMTEVQRDKSYIEMARTDQGRGAILKIPYKGKEVNVLVRSKTKSELLAHPLQALEQIGFPRPNFASQESIEDFNKFTAEYILANQQRYLNQRGVLVDLRQFPELAELGYKEMIFQRSKQGLDTRVEIGVNGLKIPFLLDREMALNLEGKTFGSSQLLESVHYLALRLLEPVLCYDVISGKNGEETGQNLEVITRMSHLRFLREGQSYTARAISLYLDKEGRDLVVKDLERKQTYNTSRVTTYVSEVVNDDQSLPPLEVDLPELNLFG